jgi:hypothetical protein
LHPTWVALCRMPQVVWDACPVDRGPLTSARWGTTFRRVKVVDAGDDDGGDHTSRVQTGRLQVPVLWDVLSCLRVLVAPQLSRSLWGTGSGCCIGPPAPVVPVQGLHGRPLYFPDSPRPWGSLVWAPSAALMPRKASVDRPRSGGFWDRARMGLFVSRGAFLASGACGSRGGDHGRPPWFRAAPYPRTRFLRRSWTSSSSSLYTVGGSGRWLLFFPSVLGSWIHPYPASLPQFHQVEGSSSGEIFPTDTT